MYKLQFNSLEIKTLKTLLFVYTKLIDNCNIRPLLQYDTALYADNRK